MNDCIRWLAMSLVVGIAMPGLADEPEYDPLQLADAELSEPLDQTITDKTRQREIPIRVFLPADQQPAPVVLFSHGLGGSREGNAFLGRHWAARGYVVVLLQHPGSDTSVWKAKPLGERLPAMQAAAGGENLMLRVKDVPAVLDDLKLSHGDKDDTLFGRLDLEHVGMSGHSFGAVTTQAVSGQTIGRGRVSFTDPRIKAAVVMSPSVPKLGDPDRAFGKVSIPWLLMTGTKDLSIIGGATMEDRLGVFPALPAGAKYEIVLHNAEHSAFTDRALPGDREDRNPNHHKAILALTTAFWDAYLKEDAAAKKWLDGEGAKSVLEEDDRWQRK